MPKNKSQKSMATLKRSQLIVYLSIVVLPVIQFCVFYIYVNFDSFTLAFRKYDPTSGLYPWCGTANFKELFDNIRLLPYMKTAFTNAGLAFVLTLCVTYPIGILSSNYIYKKYPGSELFKMLLLIPGMLSSLVHLLMYKFFVEKGVPVILEFFGKESMGLLADPDTVLGTILFYNIYGAVGGGMLTYVGMMQNVQDSLVESAKLDGITPIGEFIHITVPAIWPLVVINLYGMIAGYFGNTFGLYAFFKDEAPYSTYTIGYHMQVEMMKRSPDRFGYLSAMGMLMTIIATPLTFLVKYLLEKYGPRTD